MLDAQRSLFVTEDALVQSSGAQATDIVSVFKALGKTRDVRSISPFAGRQTLMLAFSRTDKMSGRVFKTLPCLILMATLTGCFDAPQTRIWSTVGTRYRKPSLSPDGRWLLFESRQHLYISLPDGSNPLCLSENLEGGSEARWSPDSLSIIFTGRQKGQRDLCRTDPEGRTLVNLTNTPGMNEDFVEWSPDGRRIVFYRNTPASRREELVVSAANGSDQRFLALGFIARWSPDGRWIAYDSAERDLRVIRSDGSQDHKLVAGAPIAWTPDGKAIFYRSPRSRTDEPFHVYRVGIEGGTGSLVLDNAWLDGIFDARRLWDPSGKRLALAVVPIVGRQNRNGIVLLGPQGTVLADYREREPFKYDPCVSWSADGRTLFFSKFLAYPGASWQGGIYAIGDDGSNLRQLMEDTVHWVLK